MAILLGMLDCVTLVQSVRNFFEIYLENRTKKKKHEFILSLDFSAPYYQVGTYELKTLSIGISEMKSIQLEYMNYASYTCFHTQKVCSLERVF